jgi:hypothetical protein
MRKPAPKVPKVSMSEAYSLLTGKKVLEMYEA